VKVVVVGAGQVGANLAGYLSQAGKQVVVIEADALKCAELEAELDVNVIKGSATQPGILKRAGLSEVDLFIAVTDSDETNMMTVYMASEYLPERATTMARIRNADYLTDTSVKRRFNIDVVIDPEALLTGKVLRILFIPGAKDVLLFEEGKVFVVALRAAAGGVLVEKPLWKLAREFEGMQIMVGAILRHSPDSKTGHKVVIPGGKDVIRAGDLVYFLATREALDSLVSLQGEDRRPARSILIGGGDALSIKLAEALSTAGYTTRVMIGDLKLAEAAADQLERAIVIQADPGELDVLETLLAEGVDTFIASCKEEALNIITAQIARKLGVSRAIVVTRDADFMRLVRAVDSDVVLNPFELAASYVLRKVHQVDVLEVNLFAGEDAEAFEFVPPANSPVLGKPLKNVKFPKGTLIAMIFRGDATIIPRGDDTIEPDDRVIVFCRSGSVQALERLFKPGFWA